jgi:hypothetical protein
MNWSRPVEHFVTLFNSDYLALGLTLYHSLVSNAQPFRLWVICMDEAVEESLKTFAFPNLSLIPIKDVETKELLEVKPTRSVGEYCWTITPFSSKAVFDRDMNIERVTYVDTDLFFFDDPLILLNEFARSQKHVLITTHAYAPEYDQTLSSGRFCVQFMTFRRTSESEKVMKWWQDRCIEWCYAEREDGKLGDQMYLDRWPELFGDYVHILQQVDKTFAPWNVAYFEKKLNGGLNPVFFHFEGLRITSPNKVHLYSSYDIGKMGSDFYATYVSALKENIDFLYSHDIPMKPMRRKKERLELLRHFVRKLTGRTHSMRI